MNGQRKDIIQDCNINFLIGSGLSLPYLKTLGNIESLLTELDTSALPNGKKEVIRASLYKTFFDTVITKNSHLLRGFPPANAVLKHYKDFLQIWNGILLKRKSSILGKEANVFTTNVDIFLDKALEDVGLEYNDGFNGRFSPTFSLSNFKKSRVKRSLHYDNKAEIPVFNLLKLHGSLSWELAPGERITFAHELKQVKDIAGKTIFPDRLVAIPDDATLAMLDVAANGKRADASIKAFMEEYHKLLIVNPTKDKFKHTILNQTYYELLRLYSNELEKENSVLFVMGFSFADEHIRDITLRAANSNPTLIINILAYNSAAKSEIESKFPHDKIKNQNIKFIGPPQISEPAGAPLADKFQYNLETINREYFGNLFQDEEEAAEDIDVAH